MNKQIVRIMATAVAVAALLVPSSARAELPCTDVSLLGSYAYAAGGWVATAPGQGPFTPVAEAGVFRFDGGGGFSSTNTLSFGGQIIPRTSTGSYVVERDCTGTVSIDGGVTFDLVIRRQRSKDGRVLRAAESATLVVTTPGLAVNGMMEKQ